MSLVTVEEVRALIETALSDEDLEAIIEREEAVMVKRIGANYDPDTPLVETVEGRGKYLFLERPITSITTITEARCLGDEMTELATDEFHIWHEQGKLIRLPRWTCWGEVVTVTYQPKDDNETRKALLIDLLRLTLERTGLKSESVAGEYSYTAPDWDTSRDRLLSAYGFPVV
jgi:hypothetical protein